MIDDSQVVVKPEPAIKTEPKDASTKDTVGKEPEIVRADDRQPMVKSEVSDCAEDDSIIHATSSTADDSMLVDAQFTIDKRPWKNLAQHNLECPYCHSTKYLDKNLAEHIGNNHPDMVITQPKAGFETNTVRMVRRSSRLGARSPYMRPDLVEIDVHYPEPPMTVLYQCGECSVRRPGTGFSGLPVHYRKSHPNISPFSLRCEYCTDFVVTVQSLESSQSMLRRKILPHIRESHQPFFNSWLRKYQMTDNNRGTGKKVSNDVDVDFDTNRDSDCDSDIVMLHDKPQMKCPYCGKYVEGRKVKKKLGTHIRTAHSEAVFNEWKRLIVGQKLRVYHANCKSQKNINLDKTATSRVNLQQVSGFTSTDGGSPQNLGRSWKNLAEHNLKCPYCQSIEYHESLAEHISSAHPDRIVKTVKEGWEASGMVRRSTRINSDLASTKTTEIGSLEEDIKQRCDYCNAFVSTVRSLDQGQKELRRQMTLHMAEAHKPFFKNWLYQQRYWNKQWAVNSLSGDANNQLGQGEIQTTCPYCVVTMKGSSYQQCKQLFFTHLKRAHSMHLYKVWRRKNKGHPIPTVPPCTPQLLKNNRQITIHRPPIATSALTHEAQLKMEIQREKELAESKAELGETSLSEQTKSADSSFFANIGQNQQQKAASAARRTFPLKRSLLPSPTIDDSAHKTAKTLPDTVVSQGEQPDAAPLSSLENIVKKEALQSSEWIVEKASQSP